MRYTRRISKALFCSALWVIAAHAADYPQTEISNGKIRAIVYLPDGRTGFYTGLRFDWSGVIRSLEFAGHSFYGPWFSSVDPSVRDFVYRDRDIVASSASAITGPAEEFQTPVGYDTAKPGDIFLKVGVGLLRKPDDTPYSPYKHYDLVDSGKWTVNATTSSIEFTQTLASPETGYGYVYVKRLHLSEGKPELTIDHSMHNTGKRAISTTVYDHNFLVLDGLPVGPDISVRVPYEIKSTRAPDQQFAQINGSELRYLKKLENQDRVTAGLQGFGSGASDYDFRIENRAAGAGVHITGDRPLRNASLWSIRSVMAVEPFIDVSAEPGHDFSWRYTYAYYTVVK
jgi:hypothetical protein